MKSFKKWGLALLATSILVGAASGCSSNEKKTNADTKQIQDNGSDQSQNGGQSQNNDADQSQSGDQLQKNSSDQSTDNGQPQNNGSDQSNDNGTNQDSPKSGN
jgi:hypothetical protein